MARLKTLFGSPYKLYEKLQTCKMTEQRGYIGNGNIFKGYPWGMLQGVCLLFP